MKNLRKLPPIDLLQGHPYFTKLKEEYSLKEKTLTNWLAEQVHTFRVQILQGNIQTKELNREDIIEEIYEEVIKKAHSMKKPQLQKVINATGVVLHTNLGRARLSKQAIEHLTNTASHYSTLEYHLETGKRGSRHDIVEQDLIELTGAEAAIVVNNNAAAVYFILKTLATNKEVIVSYGELVEIGGSFRISEIMEESGAKLISVGTSNKTYVEDYQRAITEDTALLLKVHKSNFAMLGFTEEVDTEDLIPLAKTYDIPVYEDLGSGTLFDFSKEKIGSEPTVIEKVSAGIDLISFSGDKLLGGPQAGIIVGKKRYIERLKNHQLARVLRVDKFTLAALEATLKSYIYGFPDEEIPTLQHILASKEVILQKAQTFIESIQQKTSSFTFTIEKGASRVGGGTMPIEKLETYVVRVRHDELLSGEMAKKLRELPVPIIARIEDEHLVLDFRTVTSEEIYTVIEGFLRIDRN